METKKSAILFEQTKEESSRKYIFDSKLHEFYESHSKSNRNMKKPWSAERISEAIKQIKDCKSRTHRLSKEYYWISKYDVMEIGGEEILIFKKKKVNDPTVLIVPMEKYYDVLTEVHETVKHGGRLKMSLNIKDKLYIPKKAIEIFIYLCPVCTLKRSAQKNGKTESQLISKKINLRGHVDLLDLQSTPDGEFKWLINYQDYTTKFIHLRPLKTMKISDIATEILKIFLEFGAPGVLHSNKGRIFTGRLVEELVKMWPECNVKNGTGIHPSTLGSIERSKDIENMLERWMQHNNSTKWSTGCYFVQYSKNCSYNSVIGKSPYHATFGCNPRVKGYNIPETSTSAKSTEEELNNVVKKETLDVHRDDNETYITTVDISNILKSASRNSEMQLKVEPANCNKTNDNILAAYTREEVPNNVEEKIIKLEIEIDKPVSIDSQTCTVCGQGTSGAYLCISCYKPVHVTCGDSSGEGGTHVLCQLCQHEFVSNEREHVHRGVKRAAEMVNATPKKLPALVIGNSVVLNVPENECGPLDKKNILGKVVDFQNGVYKIGTRLGTINNWFTRQDLEISAQDYNEEISKLPISLHQAVTGKIIRVQGSLKCTCKPSNIQCRSYRCPCFRNHSRCTSKCHVSLSCTYK